MAREGVLGVDTASSRVGMGMRRPDATAGRKSSCHATTDAATPVTHPALPSQASAGRTERPVMDAKNTNVKPWPKQGLSDHVRAAPAPVEPRPSREQAEAAVRTLIAYAGDNPTREGLLETPKRVVGAYDEIYQGYRECPAAVLDRTFSETGGYDDFEQVRDIGFTPHSAQNTM